MSTADYTLRGLEGEIADFRNVIATMKTKLKMMPDENATKSTRQTRC